MQDHLSSGLKQKIGEKKSWEIVTSLAYIFTMEIALVKIIFGCIIFICQQISKIFVALFKTFGMPKDDKIKFCLRFFRTRSYAKRQFPKDGVRRVELLFYGEL